MERLLRLSYYKSKKISSIGNINKVEDFFENNKESLDAIPGNITDGCFEDLFEMLLEEISDDILQLGRSLFNDSIELMNTEVDIERILITDICEITKEKMEKLSYRIYKREPYCKVDFKYADSQSSMGPSMNGFFDVRLEIGNGKNFEGSIDFMVPIYPYFV